MATPAEGVVVSETCGTDQVNNFDYNKLKDRKYKGEDYVVDKSVGKGLNEQRRCTDCLFLLVWIAFLVGMMAMTIDGYVNGNGAEMMAPISGFSQICGYSPGTEDYPVLYVNNLPTAIESLTDFFSFGYCA